ncbi:hypothetical protein BH10BAC3_BH10BAC3_02120 [soil metagenome]
MYDYIFFFIYSQQIRKGKSESFSRYNGALIVALSLVIHIFFCFAVYRKFFLEPGQGYGFLNRSSESVPVIVIFVLVFFYYIEKKNQ